MSRASFAAWLLVMLLASSHERPASASWMTPSRASQAPLARPKPPQWTRLTPQTGLEPLSLRAVSRRADDPRDTRWTLSLRLQDAGWDERSSSLSLDAEAPLSRSLIWEHIAAGEYEVWSCLDPGNRCLVTFLRVAGQPPA